MSEPISSQNAPYPLDIEEGKTYWYCACGRSAKQPFCDGSHKGVGLAPQTFVGEKTGKAFLCGCRRTKTPPFCDGTHLRP